LHLIEITGLKSPHKMVGNYGDTNEGGKLSGYLHGYNNLEDVRQGGIIMIKIILVSYR
jgi:hypothetical protein